MFKNVVLLRDNSNAINLFVLIQRLKELFIIYAGLHECVFFFFVRLACASAHEDQKRASGLLAL